MYRSQAPRPQEEPQTDTRAAPGLALTPRLRRPARRRGAGDRPVSDRRYAEILNEPGLSVTLPLPGECSRAIPQRHDGEARSHVARSRDQTGLPLAAASTPLALSMLPADLATRSHR